MLAFNKTAAVVDQEKIYPDLKFNKLTEYQSLGSLNPNSADTVPDSLYRWALAWWKNNTIVCNIYLDSTGEPSNEIIQKNCGNEILATWLTTPACTPSTQTGTANCSGLYLLFLGTVLPSEIWKTPELPKISTQAEIYNCNSWENCNANPQMKFLIEGEIPRAQPHSLVVKIGATKTICDNQNCILDMPITDEEGLVVEYWAESVSGEISHFIPLKC